MAPSKHGLDEKDKLTNTNWSTWVLLFMALLTTAVVIHVLTPMEGLGTPLAIQVSSAAAVAKLPTPSDVKGKGPAAGTRGALAREAAEAVADNVTAGDPGASTSGGKPDAVTLAAALTTQPAPTAPAPTHPTDDEARAMAMLINSVSPVFLPLIIDAPSVREAFVRLRLQHTQHEGANVINLRRELLNYRRGLTDTLTVSYQHLCQLRARAVDAGINIPPYEYVQQFLTTLPAEYGPYIGTLIMSLTTHTLETAHSSLLAIEAMLTSITPPAALAVAPARPASHPARSPRPGGSTIKCFYCAKTGHKKSE